MLVSKPKSTKWERYILYVREYQLIVVIQLLLVSFGPMISFGGVFMGMTMINQLLVVVVIRISLNKIGRNYTLTIRNRSRRYFTLHIFTHCLLSFKRSRCKGYVRFSRIWNIRRTNINTEMKMLSTEEIQILNKDMIVALGIAV